MRAPIRGDSQLPGEGSAPPLSRFEGQCLCQRMHECEALLQLAVLGGAQAAERHCPHSDLADIARYLPRPSDLSRSRGGLPRNGTSKDRIVFASSRLKGYAQLCRSLRVLPVKRGSGGRPC